VGRRRQGCRKIGHEGVAGRAAHAPVADQPVVCHAQHLPQGKYEADRGIGGLVMRPQLRDQGQGAATVARERRQHRHQHAAACWRESGRLVAHMDGPH
jgi:hypothetical protein